MISANGNPEKAPSTLMKTDGPIELRVFQPAKLTEIVEMIDLMGQVSERIREDSSGDWGGAGAVGVATQRGQGGASARDLAIAKLPEAPVMQRRLIAHIKGEIKKLDRQARSLARARAKGSAYFLSEIYKKIRRFSVLIEELTVATIEVIRRFYIAVFIDHQPLLVGELSTARSG